MAKNKFKNPKGLNVVYPVACAMCKVMIEKPTWDTKIGAIRPHLIYNKKGKIIIVCNDCKPPLKSTGSFVLCKSTYPNARR